GGGPGARRQARRRVTDYRGLLAELAVPRLAGTFPAEQVRAVLKRELAARGFVVMEHRFTGRSLLHRLGRVPLAGVNLIAVRPRPRSPARCATCPVGLILPDAEEYGLLGARALVRERAHLLADTTIVNFDGIDDRGLTIVLLHRAGATVDRVARTLAARRARWLPVLVDGLALAAT